MSARPGPGAVDVDATHQCLVLITHLAGLARRRSELALAPLELRPRHVIALTVLRDRGAMTQRALGDALRLDPTNLVGLLNELEGRELLERRRDPVDRRRHIVELSAAGTSTLQRAERALSSVQDEILAGLDPDQQTELRSLLAQAAAGQAAGACAEVACDEVC